MARYGLVFNGKNSITDFNTYVRNDNRVALPPQTNTEYRIPGRHGTIDYGANDRLNRLIVVTFRTVAPDYPTMRQNIRDLAYWLSRSGLLAFDDEPNKWYDAKVYDEIPLQEAFITGELTVTFSCQPFAEELNYNQRIETWTDQDKQIPLSIIGTQDTSCIITITNNGGIDINNISIIRKAEV